MQIDRKELEDYRRGIESGAMESATPNVVRSLLDTIDFLIATIETSADDLIGVQNYCHGIRGASGAKREARDVENRLRKSIARK